VKKFQKSSIFKKLFESEVPPKLFLANLILTSVVFERYNSIPNNFVDFFDLLHRKLDWFPSKEITICLFVLSSKVKFTPSQTDFLRISSGICGFLSHEFSLLMSTLISTFSNAKTAITNLVDIPAQYIDADRASQFIDGLRILNQCLGSIDPDQMIVVLEPSLANIISKSRKYELIQPINVMITQFLHEILSKSFPSLHKEISLRISKLFVSSYPPWFLEYSWLLKPLVLLIPTPEVLNLSEELLDKPTNLGIFSTALQIFSAKMNQMKDHERQAELRKKVKQFGKHLREFDCYNIRTCFVQWIHLLQAHLDLPETFQIIQYFFKQSRRFFPIFCAFTEEILVKIQSDAIVCHQAIANIVMQEKNDTRICAFEMLHAEPRIREVLDIALLENEQFSI